MNAWRVGLGCVALVAAFAAASAACGGDVSADGAGHSAGGGGSGAAGGSGGSMASGGSGAAGGNGGTSGSGATGGSGGCAAYTAQATPEELAKTPRLNATAELLAIETGTFVADDALYDRLIAELSQIFIIDPSVSAISAFSPLNSGSLLVSFDDTGWAQYQAGSYHAWDCPNQAYGAVDLGGLEFAKGTALDYGGKRLNITLLAEEYASLPNVVSAVPNAIGGDASDVCLEVQGDTHYFIFDAAAGDCPAGCIDHYYSAFSAAPGPVVQALGNYDPGKDPVAPQWYDDLADCRTRL